MRDFTLGSSLILLIVLLVVWTFLWKGWALWRSARQGSKVWFVVFLLVNTAGLLEIIYLLAFSKPEVSTTSALPKEKM